MMAQLTRGKMRTSAVAGWELVANTGAGLPVLASGTLPFLIQDVRWGRALCPLHFSSNCARAGAVRYGQQLC